MNVYLIFLFFISVLYFLYYLLWKNKNYWRNRNVPFKEPVPLFGNYKDYLLLRKHINYILQEICQEFPNEPYIGSFYGTEPALIIKDPNLLKLVMSKDFYFCNGREISDYINKELITRNVFFTTGDEWKVLRTNLTPLFSSAKLKSMFYLIKNSSDVLEILLSDEIKTSPIIDVKSLLSRYTMDCISACAFGINSETMKNDIQKNPFIAVGQMIFDTSDYKAFQNICRSMWPALYYGLGFKFFGNDINSFFNKLLSGVFKNREDTKCSRNDFVDLILTWKKDKYITGDCISNVKTGDKKVVSIEVDDNLLVAQCVVFFAGGFETTSTTTSYLLYELAKDKVAQEKVISEVDGYFNKYKTIEYECITKLPYVESCIEETLRLHPVLGVITREVMHNYTLPTGLSLKKGDRIHIPIYHIQHNPDFFPDPKVFRPERFFGEEKNNIKPFTYMPFGEGPRTCIGMRFAKMPMYAALLKIFKNYRVELAENMSQEITYNPKSLVSHPIGDIYLKFIPRNA